MAGADRAAKWQQDFQKARAELVRTSADLNRWELLSGQTSVQRTDRASQGAGIRGKVAELKVEFSRLLREVEQLGANRQQPEATRKSITQWRDELSLAISELNEVQRRSKMPSGSAAGGGGAAAAAAAAGTGAPSGDFQKMEDGQGLPRAGGTQPQQPVSQRSMFEAQQQMMRDFDEPLSALQGTVDNIGRAANQIAGEVSLQNRMLDNTNEATDRVQARMGRVRTLMVRFTENNASSRWLMCWVVILLATLIALFIWVVGS